MIPNRRESLSNNFTIKEIEEALKKYKPHKKVLGNKNGMYVDGKGEEYIRIRVNGIKVRLSHIIWRLNTKEKIPMGYNIHHKDEDKRNNLFNNLELIKADKHGQKNLK